VDLGKFDQGFVASAFLNLSDDTELNVLKYIFDSDYWPIVPPVATHHIFQTLRLDQGERKRLLV
jgi:hypothetical protein